MKLSEKVRRDIDALFVDYDSPSSPGCAIGVVKDGELAYARGYGMADLESRIPVKTGTVFHLASVSKQFTATCVALLEEEGELSLEDEAREYVDYLADCGRRLTVGNLVAMTNGLDDIYDVANTIMGVREDGHFTMEEAIAIVRSTERLAFEPGERWSYGNTGYFLLARIVERVSGLSFARFAKERVFDPLGMSRSFVREDRTMSIPDAVKTYSRAGLSRSGEPGARAESAWRISPELMELSGAGQVWSTVEDLALWEYNYYTNALGKGDPGFMRRLSRPFTLNDGGSTNYAYGQFVSEKNGYATVYHEGGSPGINTAIYRVPEKGVSIICLANSSDFIMTMLRELGEEVYERIAALVVPWTSSRQPRAQASPQPQDELGTASPSRADEEGMYADPGSGHIWEVKASKKGLTAGIDFGDRITLLSLGREEGIVERGTAYASETGGIHFTFFREGLASGPHSTLEVKNGESIAAFRRCPDGFGSPEDSEGYNGRYRCSILGTAYDVRVEGEGLEFRNEDPSRDYLDRSYAATIEDMFVAHDPPELDYRAVQFRRDRAGQVASFVFHDELQGREHWVFEKEVR